MGIEELGNWGIDNLKIKILKSSITQILEYSNPQKNQTIAFYFTIFANRFLNNTPYYNEGVIRGFLNDCLYCRETKCSR